MDWMHNPIGDMYGPYFLGFYAVVIVAVFGISKFLLYFADSTRSMELPQVPSAVDPYEIAYMRGGENEVIRLAILDLIQRGYLQRIGHTRKSDEITKAKDHPDRRHLNSIEDTVFGHFAVPSTIDKVFQSSLSSSVKYECQKYQIKLEQENCIFDGSDSGFLNILMVIGLCVIVGLGGYKLIVAVAKGRLNVGFLIMMMAAATFFYLGYCKPPRMSSKGRKYLERLKLAYAKLEDKKIKKNIQATDPTFVIMAGIFGAGALAGTVYSYYPTMFQKSKQNWYSSSSCGSSCGYSCSSGGSCGGGGGCGGGCGGCGG
jgi:uncharacterized protein (TIGR04222 family)